MNKTYIYDQKYSDEEFYWGKEPSTAAKKLIEYFQIRDNYRPKVLDLGCGEGRDLVYLAINGFDVYGVDISPVGLEKAHAYAEEVGVKINTKTANIIKYKPEDNFDAIISSGALQYLPPDVREKKFKEYKEATIPNGINLMMTFVKKPFIEKPPDAEDTAYHYISGELFSYYHDWEILYCTENIFNCISSGIPHRHAANRVVAKKV